MASHYIEYRDCPICKTKVRIDVTCGIYPIRSHETAECPICGNTVYESNITGDMDSSVDSTEETLEEYKINCINKKTL